jgi:hypothetical protein
MNASSNRTYTYVELLVNIGVGETEVAAVSLQTDIVFELTSLIRLYE